MKRGELVQIGGFSSCHIVIVVTVYFQAVKGKLMKTLLIFRRQELCKYVCMFIFSVVLLSVSSIYNMYLHGLEA